MMEQDKIAYGCCKCGCGEKTKIIAYDNKAFGEVKGEPRKYINGHQNIKPDYSSSWPDQMCACGCNEITPRQTTNRRGRVKGQPLDFIPYHHLKIRKRSEQLCACGCAETTAKINKEENKVFVFGHFKPSLETNAMMIIEYKKGQSLSNICNKFNCSVRDFNKIVLGKIPFTTDEYKKNIVEPQAYTHGYNGSFDATSIMAEYTSGTPIKEIAIRYSCNIVTIHNIRKALNVPLRARSKVYADFFDEINTACKAYWLGFLGADGNVYRNSVKIRLQSQDYAHLEKFRDALGSTVTISGSYNIRNGEKFFYPTVSIGSKELVKSLNRYNIVPNKTSTFEPPLDDIPSRFHKDFWRGMIDGDGWITICQKRDKQDINVGLAGTEASVQEFAYFIAQSVGIEYKIVKKKNKANSYQVVFSNNMLDVKKILTEIYGGAGTYLDRKYEKALLALEL